MEVISYPCLNPDVWSHEYFNISMYVHEYTIDIKSNESQKKSNYWYLARPCTC